MGKTIASREWAASNWFLLLLPVVLLGEWGFSRLVPWSDPGFAEAAMLFDLCIFVPLLYALCYRKVLPPRQLLLRTAGLACLGIFIASKLVPAEAQVVLPHLSWARIAGLAVLALIELRLMVELMKLVFACGSTAEDIASRSGMPPWVARLMLLEARFWKAVWKLIRRG